MALPMPTGKSRYKQGQYIPMNPDKYVGSLKTIRYMSGWELKFMRWCDMNPSVVHWNSEGLVLDYYSRIDGKNRRYYMDFIIKYRDQAGQLKTAIIEIKPEKQTRAPKKGRNEKTYYEALRTWHVNQDKWEAARNWAKEQGCDFIIMTEEQLGLEAPAAKLKKAQKKNG